MAYSDKDSVQRKIAVPLVATVSSFDYLSPKDKILMGK